MQNRVALVKDGTVINVILCGQSYHPDQGIDAYPLSDSSPIGIGYLRQNNTFITPLQVKPQPDWMSFVSLIPIATLTAIADARLGELISSRLTVLRLKPDSWGNASDALFSLWNAYPPILTAAQKTALETLATQHFIPLGFAKTLAGDLIYIER